MKKNILIATGGSGGHIIPAIAFYDLLKKDFNLFLTSDQRGKGFIDYRNYRLNIIQTPKIFGSLFLLPIRLLIILFLTVKCIFFLKKKKINLILTTGGYAPVPICLAGIFLKIKLYIYEPNQVVGKSNRFFLNYCHKIFCHTKKLKKYPNRYKNKMNVISPIVRRIFYKKNKTSIRKKFTIMVIGGSQSAKVFDNYIHKALIKISEKTDIAIIHQTKLDNVANLKKFYDSKKISNKVFNYEKNFIKLIKDCNFCITRAGASTLAELFLLKIPYLVVPLPSSKDNHQYENAKFYQKKTTSWLLEEKKMNKNKLYFILDRFIKDKKKIINKKNITTRQNINSIWKNQKNLLVKEFNER